MLIALNANKFCEMFSREIQMLIIFNIFINFHDIYVSSAYHSLSWMLKG